MLHIISKNVGLFLMDKVSIYELVNTKLTLKRDSGL